MNISNLFSYFLPKESGLSDFEKKIILKTKKIFSHYLPYDKYDPETQFYYNKDNSTGFMFLCSPFWNENSRARTIFKAIIQELPEKSVLSVHFISLDYLKPVLDRYVELKKARKNSIIEESARNLADFLIESSKKGLPHLLGTPLRNFILLISFKFSGKKDIDWLINYRTSIQEQLKGCNLNPYYVEPNYLINYMFNLFNGKWTSLAWDDKRSLSSQMLLADTHVKIHMDMIEIGNKKWACIVPKHLPKDEFDPSIIGELTGPSTGPIADGKQIKSHFIYSVIVYRDSTLHGEITKKAGLFFNQLKGDAHKSIIGRLVGEYAIEHSQAVEDIEKGDKFFYLFPILWLWNEDEIKLKQSIQQAKNLFEEQGFTTDIQLGILSVLFLMSLPFGFNLSPKEITLLDRHFVCKATDAAGLIPLVGDISGFGDPVCLFVSRKGQIVTFDPFYKESPNKNSVVMGLTGGGKSVNMNLLIYSMYANGALIRIVDLGYSYLKQCKLFNGEYIDFSADDPICLNPFSFINTEGEDFYGSLASITEMILSMAFEGSQEIITKEHISLVRSAVEWAWREWQTEAGIDNIYRYLAEFPNLAGDEIGDICQNDETCLPDLKKEAQKIAFSLTNWTSEGPFGKWFNGKSTIDLVSSDYLVLELERLKRIPSLLKLISLAVMNATTASFYLSDRNKKKIFLLEECGIILKDVPTLKGIIQEAYRRIRKYKGAAITVFQSPMDISVLGEVGQVILGNSAYWFMLPSDQYEKARKEKIIDLPQEIISILSTIKLTAPRYGELGLKTPWGFGVVRTILNGFFYYLVTTDPDDWQRVVVEAKEKEKEYKKQGVESPMSMAYLSVMKKLGEQRDKKFYEKFM